jgi:hypothetical protein
MAALSSLHLLDLRALGGALADVARFAETGEVVEGWSRRLGAAGALRPADRDRATLSDALDTLRPYPGGTELRPLDAFPTHRVAEVTRRAVTLHVVGAAVGDGVDLGRARHLAVAAAPHVESLERWLARGFHGVPRGAGVVVFALDAALAAWSDGGGLGMRGALDVLGCEVLVKALERLPDAALADERALLGPTLGLARHALARGDTGLLHGRDLPLAAFGRWQMGAWMRA